jgi:hypothetical protein
MKFDAFCQSAVLEKIGDQITAKIFTKEARLAIPTTVSANRRFDRLAISVNCVCDPQVG